MCEEDEEFASTAVRRYAQPFVADGTGMIGAATFQVIDLSANTPFGVEIRTTQNGAPTTQVLGTTFVIDIPATTTLDRTRTVAATFDPKVPVAQGVTYALVFTDVANKGFTLPRHRIDHCSLTYYYDPDATNAYSDSGSHMNFSVSP